jgi:hypothetical protein
MWSLDVSQPYGPPRSVKGIDLLNLSAICELIVYRQCGSLDVSQPYGPPRPSTGIALLNLSAICEPIVYRKCGSLDVSQPYGPPRPVTGIALPLPFFYSLTINDRFRFKVTPSGLIIYDKVHSFCIYFHLSDVPFYCLQCVALQCFPSSN